MGDMKRTVCVFGMPKLLAMPISDFSPVVVVIILIFKTSCNSPESKDHGQWGSRQRSDGESGVGGFFVPLLDWGISTTSVSF